MSCFTLVCLFAILIWTTELFTLGCHRCCRISISLANIAKLNNGHGHGVLLYCSGIEWLYFNCVFIAFVLF